MFWRADGDLADPLQSEELLHVQVRRVACGVLVTRCLEIDLVCLIIVASGAVSCRR